jgi:hypothetical protein
MSQRAKTRTLAMVEPGSPDKSYLYLKLTNQHQELGSGVQMPYLQTPLDQAQIETIRLWIEQNAPKD